MNTIEVVRGKFRALGFNTMAASLDTLVARAQDAEVSFLQFADMLVDHELAQRRAKRVAYNLKRAALPVVKHMEDFDFTFQTTIAKRQVTRLLDFTFIDNRENVVFLGPPGTGKTHLAIGLAVQAAGAGYKPFFSSALALLETLDLAEMRGELKARIAALLKFDVIVIDELGYLPLNRKSAHNFFQLINAMYEYRSIILTANKDFPLWGEFFFEDNVTVPIVDRIIHHSHIFMLGGDSYRLKQKTNSC